MNPSLKIVVDLKPIVEKDEETGLFIARFSELPQSVAYDETEEKAVMRLISIFEVFLREQKELIFEKIIRQHFEKAMQDDPSFQFIRIQGINNETDKMKLEMVS